MPRVQGHRLFELFEQDKANGTFSKEGGYEKWVRRAFGVTEGPGGGLEKDAEGKEFSARDVDFRDLTEAFLGTPRKKPGPTQVAEALRAHAMRRVMGFELTESEGHVVLPSHFQNVSAYAATVFGLLDAMAMEGYDPVPELSQDLFDAEDTRTNGGRKIGLMNDGQWGDDLIPGEPYPTVGLKETYVQLPENQRRGNVIQLVVQDLLYDRTEMIQEKAGRAGDAVKRGKEIKCADVFLGVVNPYSRDGSASNTYLDARGTAPNDYLNTKLLQLTTMQDIDSLIITMQQNTDPGTGFEIEFKEPYQVAVMPHQWLELLSIVKSTSLETRIVTSDTTQIRHFDSPLYSVNPIKLSMLWYNRMLAAASSGTYAANRWFIASGNGGFKRAFSYRTLIPFQTQDAPLSSEDVRRDIVIVKVALEQGVPYVKDPRFVGRGTEEDVTP